MKTSDTFRQYIWLVNTIKRSRKISLKRIQQLWIDNDINNGKPLSRTTFHRLKLAIEDMFGIQIECDTTDCHQYFIGNPETLTNNSTQSWMLRTLTINNVLMDSAQLKDRIILENIPSGNKYLTTAIEAMRENRTLLLTYQSFTMKQPRDFEVLPYCLRCFKQRWYILGKREETKSRISSP